MNHFRVQLYHLAAKKFVGEAVVPAVPVPGEQSFICMGDVIYRVVAIVLTGSGPKEGVITATVSTYAARWTALASAMPPRSSARFTSKPPA